MSIKIHQFNVDAGDHCLIQFSKSSYGIIDFHFGHNLNEPPAKTFLEDLLEKNKNLQINIEFIIISHYDWDHIKGLKDFVDWMSDNEKVIVKNVFFPMGWDGTRVAHTYNKCLLKYLISKRKGNKDFYDDYVNQTRSYIAIVNKLEEYCKGKGAINIPNKDYLSKGLIHDNLHGFRMFCLAPLNSHIIKYNKTDLRSFFYGIFNEKKRLSNSRNQLSSVVLFQHKKFNITFCGDSPEKIINDGLKYIDSTLNLTLKNYKSIYIKAGHHGSVNSSSEDLWKYLINDKQNFVLGFSAGLKYKHPHPSTIKHLNTRKQIDKWENKQFKIFSTNSCAKSLSSKCTDCIEEELNKTTKDDLFIEQDEWLYGLYNISESNNAKKNHSDTNEKFKEIAPSSIDDTKFYNEKDKTTMKAIEQISSKIKQSGFQHYIVSNIVNIPLSKPQNIFTEHGISKFINIEDPLKFQRRMLKCTFNTRRKHQYRISDLNLKQVNS